MQIYKSTTEADWSLDDNWRHSTSTVAGYTWLPIDFSVVRQTDLMIVINISPSNLSNLIKVVNDLYTNPYYYILQSYERQGTTLIATYVLDTLTTFNGLLNNVPQYTFYLKRGTISLSWMQQNGNTFKGQQEPKEIETNYMQAYLWDSSGSSQGNAVMNGIGGGDGYFYTYGVVAMGQAETNQSPNGIPQPYYSLIAYNNGFQNVGDSNGISWWTALQNSGDELVDLITLPFNIGNGNGIFGQQFWTTTTYQNYTGNSNSNLANVPVFCLPSAFFNVGNLSFTTPLASAQQGFGGMINITTDSGQSLPEIIKTLNGSNSVIIYSNLGLYIWQWIRNNSITFSCGGSSVTWTLEELNGRYPSSDGFQLMNCNNWNWYISFNFPYFYIGLFPASNYQNPLTLAAKQLRINNSFSFVKGATGQFLKQYKSIIATSKEALNINNNFIGMKQKEQYANEGLQWLNPSNWFHISQTIENDTNTSVGYNNSISLNNLSYSESYGTARVAEELQINQAVTGAGAVNGLSGNLMVSWQTLSYQGALKMAAELYEYGVNVCEYVPIQAVALGASLFYYMEADLDLRYINSQQPETLTPYIITEAQARDFENRFKAGIKIWNGQRVNQSVYSENNLNSWIYNQSGLI